MRITCFILGVCCLLGSGAWLVIGTVNFSDSRGASPTSANFRMAQEAADTSSPDLGDFGPASTLAEVFAVAGVAWMIGALSFAPKEAAPAAAAAPQQQWQPQQQHYPAQQQYPQQGQQG